MAYTVFQSVVRDDIVFYHAGDGRLIVRFLRLYYLSEGPDPVAFIRNFKTASPSLPPLILQRYVA
jgi:hypothetical protein